MKFRRERSVSHKHTRKYVQRIMLGIIAAKTKKTSSTHFGIL